MKNSSFNYIDIITKFHMFVVLHNGKINSKFTNSLSWQI